MYTIRIGDLKNGLVRIQHQAHNNKKKLPVLSEQQLCTEDERYKRIEHWNISAGMVLIINTKKCSELLPKPEFHLLNINSSISPIYV